MKILFSMSCIFSHPNSDESHKYPEMSDFKKVSTAWLPIQDCAHKKGRFPGTSQKEGAETQQGRRMTYTGAALRERRGIVTGLSKSRSFHFDTLMRTKDKALSSNGVNGNYHSCINLRT